MNWYLAKIIFGIRTGDSGMAGQFDEQLRLISARNETEAFLKARMIGVREEDSFMNDKQHSVSWEFIDIADLHLVDELKDGLELSSRVHETDEPENYISFVHHRAKKLQEKTEQHLVALQ